MFRSSGQDTRIHSCVKSVREFLSKRVGKPGKNKTPALRMPREVCKLRKKTTVSFIKINRPHKLQSQYSGNFGIDDSVGLISDTRHALWYTFFRYESDLASRNSFSVLNVAGFIGDLNLSLPKTHRFSYFEKYKT